MTQTYKYSIVYFLAFSMLLVGSGVMLFEQKIGFSTNAIVAYYLGDEDKFIVAKSSTGILKIVLPHLFAFGLFAMVILHFLIFTKYKDTKQIKILIYILFTSAFLEVFSPFFIILGAEFFSYIKITSFIVLESLIIYISWLLLNSIMNN
ncbi:MAG: hypothetical protein ACI9TV_001687 [Sulfurimonas sp.]|jgi:hypothetical protein|uniref:hypothetical protein n=1 Tax=Sulfurimonas sp. TaxID=2022749 RepID=UPI0039E6E066